MAKIDTLKTKLQAARDEHTRATAVMEEVKTNIAKEVANLRGLGVVFDDRAEDQDEGEWYNYVQKTTQAFVEDIEDDITTQTSEVEKIIAKWSEAL